jgi:hypothetical protein
LLNNPEINLDTVLRLTQAKQRIIDRKLEDYLESDGFQTKYTSGNLKIMFKTFI